MEVRLQISTPVSGRGAWLKFQIFSDLQQPFLHLWTSDSWNRFCAFRMVFINLSAAFPRCGFI